MRSSRGASPSAVDHEPHAADTAMSPTPLTAGSAEDRPAGSSDGR
jgi:hypothetical protein